MRKSSYKNGRKLHRRNGHNGHQTPQQSAQGHAMLLVGGSGKVVGQAINEDERLAQDPQITVGEMDGDVEDLDRLNSVSSYALTHVPAHDLVGEVKQNPAGYPGYELLDNLDQIESDLPAGTDNLNRGAPGGERQLGMMMGLFHLWRHFSLVISFLLGLLQPLVTKDQPGNGTPETSGAGQLRPQVIISLVASACGGTGSALAVLLSDLMRYLARYILGIRRVEYEAHLVLPGVFVGRAVDLQALLAKTYGFFVELLARFERDWPAVRVSQFLLARPRGPFAWVYLYDTINHREQMVTTREQLAQVIKHVWEYINFGPVADRYRSLLEHMHTEFPKVFSAAGMAGLEYPVKRIQKQGAYQTGLYVIRDLVSPHPEAKAVGQELLADFLRQQPEFETLPPLRQGVNGKPVLPGYAQFEQTVMNLPRQQFLSGMDSVMDRVLTDTQAGLDGKIEAEIQRLSQLLAQQGISIANKPHGLSLAATFLTAFDALMTQHQTALKLRIERGQAEGNRLRQNIKTLEEKWLPKLTLKVRRQHQQARYDLLVHRVNSKITHGQYQVVSRLREQVRDDLKALAGMAGALRDLHDRVQSAEADYIRRQQNRISVVFESLLDETEIDQVVANRLAERGSQARDGLRFEWAGDGRLTLLYRDSQESGLDHWQLVSPEGVEQHMAYCHTFWQYLAGECSVEGYLHQHGIDRAQLIAHLEQQAAPWVTINQARQVPAEHRLLVLGTETGPAFISEAPSHINVVATGDKTRLVLLSTVHGFDVMNLQQTPAWQDAYEQQLAAGKSVHVMPEVDPLAQPQETKSESNREINQEKEMTYVAA